MPKANRKNSVRLFSAILDKNFGVIYNKCNKFLRRI